MNILHIIKLSHSIAIQRHAFKISGHKLNSVVRTSAPILLTSTFKNALIAACSTRGSWRTGHYNEAYTAVNTQRYSRKPS